MKKILLTCLLTLSLFAETHTNQIQDRLQWRENSGYCGEISLICAGLYFGQYLSQYDARALVGTQTGGEVLLGINDKKAAEAMHLVYEEWASDTENSTKDFLNWVKNQVVSGNPVAIGIYENQYLFYDNPDPSAGDNEYDHIVPVMEVTSQNSWNDPAYSPNDTLTFSDNGLWDDQITPQTRFTYSFDEFQKSRIEANGPNKSIYSLSNSGTNYGIAIKGIKDLDGNTLPIRIETFSNFEKPSIAEGSNERPASMLIPLKIEISNLEPNVDYILYRYNHLDVVPDAEFNAHAEQASAKWKILIPSGSTYQMKETIQSSETAVYRCVKASAP